MTAGLHKLLERKLHQSHATSAPCCADRENACRDDRHAREPRRTNSWTVRMQRLGLVLDRGENSQSPDFNPYLSAKSRIRSANRVGIGSSRTLLAVLVAPILSGPTVRRPCRMCMVIVARSTSVSILSAQTSPMRISTKQAIYTVNAYRGGIESCITFSSSGVAGGVSLSAMVFAGHTAGEGIRGNQRRLAMGTGLGRGGEYRVRRLDRIRAHRLLILGEPRKQIVHGARRDIDQSHGTEKGEPGAAECPSPADTVYRQPAERPWPCVGR